ncbi:iron-containing alcohol dehydrogenase [bacterium]|nr:iron-containing alcohol dehydrogenase [bacterium]
MENFSFQNPVRIHFGKGQIARLAEEIPAGTKVLLTYGGGSIKANGVYDQVKQALAGREVLEFGGIEPNPRFETLMPAVELVRKEGVEFLLAVGGGSVLDGTKFIAAAVNFEGDPWDILAKGARVKSAIPLGAVLTLPATGSEMNGNSVVTKWETRDKLAFSSKHVYPRFSILDPETTFSLPPRQVANGIVDAFVHTTEQYLTYPADAPLQDRMAEAILSTLVEVGPETLANPTDYQARASFMWSATMALNGIIGVGVPQDWATHSIGHELTALHGLDHGQTLAVVLPAIMEVKRQEKAQKLLQYGERVWGIREGDDEKRMVEAIAKTRAFFESLGVPTRLEAYGVSAETIPTIVDRMERRGDVNLGEREDIGVPAIRQILEVCCR